ncbi:MAG: hypothetical protein ACOH2F_16665 [Cellulomonas sp.]
MSDPTQVADVGVEGNSRLTATVGVVLVVLLFAEGLTILSIRGLITVHVFIGLLLVPPVALKVLTTTYRFARYYAHAAPYVRRGPPHPLLRFIGPVLVIVTVVLLGSGVALLVVGPADDGLVLLAHKGSFVVWFGLTAVHVLAHVRESVVLAGRDWRSASRRPRPRGRAGRAGAVVLALVLGVVLGALVTPTAAAWTDRPAHAAGQHLAATGVAW